MTHIKNPIDELSIFTHDKMSKKKFAAIKIFCDAYLTKFVASYDLFCKINSFINYKNSVKDNYFAPDSQLLDLEVLLNIGGVTEPDHIAVFEEIAFNLLDSEGSCRDRAIRIHDAWRKKALEIHRNASK